MTEYYSVSRQNVNFNHKIEELTGKPPISFADFIKKNRAAFTS
jgi:hypothetical protein